jgi:hypothetical protein
MTNHPTYIYFDQGEHEFPSLQYTYLDWHHWIFSQYLPSLIEHSEQLAYKLHATSQHNLIDNNS